LKWVSLPLRDHLKHTHNPPDAPGVGATEEEIDMASEMIIREHHAFIAYTGEPRNYQEVMQSTMSKEWEMSIQKEYENLKSNGTFE
jgi:hypothetical protein